VIYLAARARSLSRAAERAAVSSVLFINDPRPRIPPPPRRPSAARINLSPWWRRRRRIWEPDRRQISDAAATESCADLARCTEITRWSSCEARGSRGVRGTALRCTRCSHVSAIFASPSHVSVSPSLVLRERARLSGDTYRSRRRRAPDASSQPIMGEQDADASSIIPLNTC